MTVRATVQWVEQGTVLFEITPKERHLVFSL